MYVCVKRELGLFLFFLNMFNQKHDFAALLSKHMLE